jgi:hypothetical protein
LRFHRADFGWYREIQGFEEDVDVSTFEAVCWDILEFSSPAR